MADPSDILFAESFIPMYNFENLLFSLKNWSTDHFYSMIANVIHDLYTGLEQDSIGCKQMLHVYLNYSKTTAMRSTEIQLMTNCTYYLNFKKYRKKPQKLKDGLEGLRGQYSHVMDKCNFTIGDPIDPPMLGDPQNLCVLGAVHYELYVDENGYTNALGKAKNEMYYANAYLPEGNGLKLRNYPSNHCVS